MTQSGLFFFANLELTEDLSNFRQNIGRYHWWAVLWKSFMFGSIGYVFSGTKDVSGGRLSFAVAVLVLLVMAMEYFWFYRPNLSKHFELLDRFGTVYEEKLRQAIREIGYGGIVNRYWLPRCHDEMVRDDQR